MYWPDAKPIPQVSRFRPYFSTSSKNEFLLSISISATLRKVALATLESVVLFTIRYRRFKHRQVRRQLTYLEFLWRIRVVLGRVGLH